MKLLTVDINYFLNSILLLQDSRRKAAEDRAFEVCGGRRAEAGGRRFQQGVRRLHGRNRRRPEGLRRRFRKRHEEERRP